MKGGSTMNYDKITQEEFDEKLKEIINDEYETFPANILTIPGIYEILSEHFNNAVLAKWETDQIDKIPDDLVLLPNYGDLDIGEVSKVENAIWYETPDGFLLASAEEINYLSEADPLDAGYEFDKTDLIVVDDILKRCNPVYGFYHA